MGSTPPVRGFVEVMAENLHVRPTAGTQEPPLTTVGHGTRLAVTGEASAGWLPVTSDAGPGWVAAGLVARLPALTVDLYRADDRGAPDWSGVTADVRYVGAILKATEGTAYPTAWFVAEWPRLRAAAGARFGATFFRGAYHYLSFGDDGAAQADYFLATVDKAGGWDAADLVPIVDVERGGASSPNQRADAARVIEVTSAYVARVAAVTGQPVMLYGRGAMRDLGIRSRMGAQYLWNPGYTAALPATEAIGWPSDEVVLWQYTDGTHNATRYPTEAPGLGAVDASVYLPGDLVTLAATLVRRAPTPGGG